jgi:SAM-dependent methyltransferase
MFESQELQLEQAPAVNQLNNMMHEDMRQQLEVIRQQLVELRQEVGDTRQQLTHMQAQVSTLYGLSHYIGPHDMQGLHQWTLLMYVLLTPCRWLLAPVRWLRARARRGKQMIAKLHPLRFWSLLYWILFGLVLWRGRLIGWYQRRHRPIRCDTPQSVPQATLAPQTESTNKPVNLLCRDAARAKLQEDVEYAIQVGQNYLNLLAAHQINLQDKVLLEIGPGTNYGSTLVLACHGAKVMVADRFLAPWDPDYHPHFYALLRDRVQEKMPGADVRPLEAILAHGGYTPDSIRCYATSLEELTHIPTASVDIIFSNAVLEHVYDPATAFKSLARVSKPGGRGFHQVDFRDHRSMERPLEFLLMSPADFAREFVEIHGERGNRYRPWEYAQLFESVGFQVLKFEPSAFADDDYLQEFIPRLRAVKEAKHRDAEADMLKVVGGYYVVTRTA